MTNPAPLASFLLPLCGFALLSAPPSVSVFVLCPDTARMPWPGVGVVPFEFYSYQSHALTKTSSPYTSPRLRHFVLATQISLRG